MRYFTREQHDRANSSDRLEVAASREEFNRCCELYGSQLDELKTRLADAWSFFHTVSLHDGTLLALRIGDDIDKKFSDYASRLVNRRIL
jgi:triphosphoribosyl-dephospho-CoA synthetase